MLDVLGTCFYSFNTQVILVLYRDMQWLYTDNKARYLQYRLLLYIT